MSRLLHNWTEYKGNADNTAWSGFDNIPYYPSVIPDSADFFETNSGRWAWDMPRADDNTMNLMSTKDKITDGVDGGASDVAEVRVSFDILNFENGGPADTADVWLDWSGHRMDLGTMIVNDLPDNYGSSYNEYDYTNYSVAWAAEGDKAYVGDPSEANDFLNSFEVSIDPDFIESYHGTLDVEGHFAVNFDSNTQLNDAYQYINPPSGWAMPPNDSTIAFDDVTLEVYDYATINELDVPAQAAGQIDADPLSPANDSLAALSDELEEKMGDLDDNIFNVTNPLRFKDFSNIASSGNLETLADNLAASFTGANGLDDQLQEWQSDIWAQADATYDTSAASVDLGGIGSLLGLAAAWFTPAGWASAPLATAYSAATATVSTVGLLRSQLKEAGIDESSDIAGLEFESTEDLGAVTDQILDALDGVDQVTHDSLADATGTLVDEMSDLMGTIGLRAHLAQVSEGKESFDADLVEDLGFDVYDYDFTGGIDPYGGRVDAYETHTWRIQDAANDETGVDWDISHIEVVERVEFGANSSGGEYPRSDSLTQQIRDGDFGTGPVADGFGNGAGLAGPEAADLIGQVQDPMIDQSDISYSVDAINIA